MIEKILQALAKIPADKIAHFAGGSILAAAGLLVGHLLDGAFGTPDYLAALGLFMTAPVVGLAKETWDLWHPPHVSDGLDLLATVAGAFPVWIAFFVAGLR